MNKWIKIFEEDEERLWKLDKVGTMFVSGFVRQFDEKLFATYLALNLIEDVSFPKDGLNIWRESELMGELIGKIADIHIKILKKKFPEIWKKSQSKPKKPCVTTMCYKK